MFDTLADSTGVGRGGQPGLRLFVRTDHLYWFAVEQGADGSGRAVFFAIEDPTGRRRVPRQPSSWASEGISALSPLSEGPTTAR